jgi:hypothetical protein
MGSHEGRRDKEEGMVVKMMISPQSGLLLLSLLRGQTSRVSPELPWLWSTSRRHLRYRDVNYSQDGERNHTSSN